MCLFGQGFDEYMNLVLDEAEEVHMKSKNRKTLGELWASPNNIREGEKCPYVHPYGPSVRPSVHKKFLRFE